MTKVYVIEHGCYDDRYVGGVYSTPEKAMASHQPKAGAMMGPEYGYSEPKPWSYQWAVAEEGEHWVFGADWGDAATIKAYELDG